MIKINLKTNKLFEIRKSEYEPIEALVRKHPTQFNNIFGDKKRIVIENGELKNQEDIIYAIENPVEKVYSKYLLSELIKFIDKLSINQEENRYIYGVNLESSSIVRIYDKIIPTGPKKGEKIQKIEKIKLRDLQNILAKCIDSIRTDKQYLDFDKEIKKIFPVVNPEMEKYFKDAESFIMHIVNMAMPEINNKLGSYRNPVAGTYADKIKKQSKKPMDSLVHSLSIVSQLTGDYVIVVSRARMDIARMSDFPGIQSCHSPPRPKKDKEGNIIRRRPLGMPDASKEKEIEGKWFSCAIQEAKDNGVIAFLMPRKSVEEYKDKLQADEFYRDIERDVEGTLPMQRIRLRKYLHIPTMTYLLVPEMEIYGSYPSKQFLNSVLDWAVEVQTNEINKIKSNELYANDFVLIGGSYADTPTNEMLSYFLSEPVELSPEYQDIEPDMNDPRISEKLLDKQDFIHEIIKLAGVLDSEKAIKAASDISVDSKTSNKYINYNIKYYMEKINVDKKISTMIKKDTNLMSSLSHKAIEETIKNGSGVSGLSYNVRYPIYNPLINHINFYIEIKCNIPENGDFTDEEINNVLKVSKLLGFLLRRKEEFEKIFNNILKQKVDEYFNVKEQKARTTNYYLRG
jgi:hypothetical protein